MSDHEDTSTDNSFASLGGKASAAKLTPEQRRERAQQAADARWSLPRATHGSPDSPLRIGGVEIPCYVLNDGTRVLSQAGFLEALGRHRKARVRNPVGEDPIPAMLQGKSIKPFISKELLEKSAPIVFRTPDGVRAKGYRAEILPEVCEVYLRARDANELPANQQHVAKQAEILIRGLAHVGIIALVDEATGYQDARARDALAKILEAFIAKDLRKWVPTFDPDFYKEMFRLRGIEYAGTVKGPRYIGRLTNDLVYTRLAPGVLEELRSKNPVTESGYRKNKHHQWLTEGHGHPELKAHLKALIALMKASDEWDQFYKMVQRSLPKYISMPLWDHAAENAKETKG